MHHLLNSMLALIRHNFSILLLFSLGNNSQCRVDKTLAHGLGPNYAERLGVPKPLLGGKEMFFEVCCFGWTSIVVFHVEKRN